VGLSKKRTITLKVNSETYSKYRELCQEEGWIVSRKFEKMMEKVLSEYQSRQKTEEINVDVSRKEYSENQNILPKRIVKKNYKIKLREGDKNES